MKHFREIKTCAQDVHLSYTIHSVETYEKWAFAS